MFAYQSATHPGEEGGGLFKLVGGMGKFPEAIAASFKHRAALLNAEAEDHRRKGRLLAWSYERRYHSARYTISSLMP
jgi:hypothetical protein